MRFGRASAAEAGFLILGAGRGAEAPLFHGIARVRACSGKLTIKIKVKIKVKGSGQSARSTRAKSLPDVY